jgi:hypothetical protein
LRRIERNIHFPYYLTAKLFQLLLGKLVRHPRPHVIRTDHEELLAEMFGHVLHVRPDLLGWLRPEHENVLIANSRIVFLLLTLVERRVEQHLIRRCDYRARRIPLCTAEGAGEEVHALLANETVRLLDHDAWFGLGITDDDLDLSAEHPAIRIDLLDGEPEAGAMCLTVNRPCSGKGRYQANLDRRFRAREAQHAGHRQRRSRHAGTNRERFQCRAPVHGVPPKGHSDVSHVSSPTRKTFDRRSLPRGTVV